ncbi:hypothetical protein ACOME3_009637 [Neoechinorhynchus agilis]
MYSSRERCNDNSLKDHQSAKRFCNTSMSLGEIDAAAGINAINMAPSTIQCKRDGGTHSSSSSIATKLSICDSSLTGTPSTCYYEGYLLKKSQGRFKSWSKKWFILTDKKLVYLTDSSVGFHTNFHFGGRKRQTLSFYQHWLRRNNHFDSNALSTVDLISDIKLCSVRESINIDRLFVFEIQSPSFHYYLQADSAEERERWMDAMRQAIMCGIQTAPSLQDINVSESLGHVHCSNECSSTEVEVRSAVIRERKQAIQSLPGNNECCDCGALRPEWASVNLGILLCLKCSGIHRGLGVNTSKIRSLHIDEWDIETLIMMTEIGNQAFNAIYEANRRDVKSCKPYPSSAVNTRKRFIDAKYIQKKFIVQKAEEDLFGNDDRRLRWIYEYLSSKNEANPDDLLRSSIENSADTECNLLAVLLALGLGADRNARFDKHDNQSPLSLAIRLKCLPICEFLLQNGARTDQIDNNGCSPLHYAVQHSGAHRCLVILLLKRNTPTYICDNDGKDPLDHALCKKDPDITTWIRLVRLNKELEDEDPEIEKCFLPFLEDPVYLTELAKLHQM